MRAFVVLWLVLVGSHLGPASAATSPRQRQSLDLGWRFVAGDPVGAEHKEFDDGGWQAVDLPHDWSVAGPFLEDSKSGRAGGYAPLGVGWYRRSFVVPEKLAGKSVFIEFEGVFAVADVWLNGEKVGHNDFGYLGFPCDLTHALVPGGTNLVAVRVENLKPISRWYKGSGIYRHVWLEFMEPLHVVHWGSYVTTPSVTAANASVNLRLAATNQLRANASCVIRTRIADPGGKVVAEASVTTNISAGAGFTCFQEFAIGRVQLWSPGNPCLYRALSRIESEGRWVDEYETPFGIRNARFDPNDGFWLNGVKTVLKGVCIHHDNGALGAAAFDRAMERRLQILKGMGCNAVRLSHNPHAPAMLDLCDGLGLLVIDEAFDKWAGFTPEGDGWRENLLRFIARDRNHPSVILWSVGNEVKEQLKPEGTALMRRMAEAVRAFEPTRPVTCALHPARLPGFELPEMAAAMDVVSMNYQTRLYDRDHRAHPEFIILGSETLPFYAYNEAATGPKDKFLPGNSWFAVKDYVAGQFIWAGIDYLGESVGWPWRGWSVGLVDTCGFRKDFSYYQESLYSDKPMVRIVVFDPEGGDVAGKKGWGWPKMASHWNWASANKTLKVGAFSNCSILDLFLNHKLLGRRRLSEFSDRIPTWDVPYEPGTLRVTGRDNDTVVCTHELRTAGLPGKLALLPDRTRLAADGQDLCHLTVGVLDSAGTLVPGAESLVSFDIKGPGRIIGVDNGDLSSPESYQGFQRTTKNGRCLAVIRASTSPGQILVTGTSKGLKPATACIEVKEAE
jgi:beta-galactosidase